MTDRDPQTPKFLGRTLDPHALTYRFADGSGVAIPAEVAQDIGNECTRLSTEQGSAVALLDYIAARKAALGNGVSGAKQQDQR